MKRVYIGAEVADCTDFDPSERRRSGRAGGDVLHFLPGVTSATVYASAADLAADED